MRTAPPIITTAPGTRAEAFGPTEWALLLAIAAMWGSSFLWIAIGLETFRPGLIALLRIALGAVALALVRGSRSPVAREDWPSIVLLGLIWMGIPLLLFPIAQDLGISSSVAGMLNGAMPLFAALFASVLLRQAPGVRHVVGLVVGFAGVVLVTLPSAQGTSGTALGAGLLILATAMYGLSANITVPLQQKYGALPVVFRAQLVALVAVAPVGGRQGGEGEGENARQGQAQGPGARAGLICKEPWLIVRGSRKPGEFRTMVSIADTHGSPPLCL